jgi:hypothetical protein
MIFNDNSGCSTEVKSRLVFSFSLGVNHGMPVTRWSGFVIGGVVGPWRVFKKSGAPVSSLQPGERAREFLGPEGGQVVNPFADADEVDR